MPGNTAAAATLGAQASSKDAQASVPNLPTGLSDSPAPASAPALDHSNTGQVLSLKIANTARWNGSGSIKIIANAYESYTRQANARSLNVLITSGIIDYSQSVHGSSPLLLQQTLATSTKPGGSNVGQAPPTQRTEHSAIGLGTSSSLGSIELAAVKTPTNAPSLSALGTSIASVSPAASLIRNSSGAPALSVPAALPLNFASQTSTSGLGDLVTIQITNVQGPPIPAVISYVDNDYNSSRSASKATSTSKPSSTTTSSASTSSSSSSTSSCSHGLTISGTIICNIPTLEAVVDRQIQAGASVTRPTGSKKPPRKTHHVVSVASITSLIPSNQTSVPSSLVESMPSSAIASMSSRNNTMLPLFKSTGNSSTATKSPQSSSSSAVSTSSNMSTTPTPQTTSSPPPPSPAEPLSSPLTVTPVDPPSNPSCHHPPSEPYEDVQPDNTEKAASTFCSEYDKQILHPGDAAVVKKLISLDSGADTGRITVEWVEGYSSDANVDGYTIGHPSLIKPLSSDSYGCRDILQNTYWGCKSNKGRAGCITAGCLKYCLNPGPDTVLPAKQPCTRHPCAEGQ
ncbi:MAG: hypothetical protein Q9200_004867 [Gallowayella weberi]